MKTRSGLPKYCSFNTDRHGTRRVMFRRRGFATYLSGIPWSEDFMRRYAIALGGTKPDGVGVGATQTATGSLNSARILGLAGVHAGNAPWHYRTAT